MNHNVLLIEDDPAVVRMIQEALADASDGPFIVECVRRLSEGLDRLNEGGIAAVLLDLFLPDSQGVNTFGRLGAQLCDIKAGNCSDAWADPVTPSQIYSVVTGPGGIYAAGYEGDGVNREAMLLKITVNGGAVQVNKFIPDFQIATGVRAEGYMVKVGQDNNIYLGVNSDCPRTSSSSSCVNILGGGNIGGIMRTAVKYVSVTIVGACLVLLLNGLSLSAQDTGCLKVKAHPGSAGVFVDDQYEGPASNLGSTVRYCLSPGEHKITLRDSHYQDFSTTVMIEAHKTTTLPQSLQVENVPPPPYGLLRVQGGACKFDGVFVNGRYVGHVGEFDGAGKGMLLTPGEYTVKVVFRGGDQEFEEKVKIEAKKTTRIRIGSAG